MTTPPPLTGIRVLEFAGLAPGPFAGLMLADYGATVIRIDRPTPTSHGTSTPPPPTSDLLTRRKTSIAVDMKTAAGAALIKALAARVDVLIDPFRPGVLERAGLSPREVLLPANPRLVVARLTGFRRDGPYARMAGHDINYLAVSGVLGMLGRKAHKPYAPGNLVADFAGGGAMCVVGVLMALVERARSGRGQLVEANMVDGAAYLATFLRLGTKSAWWGRPRGENLLDGGCPYYDVYATKDGQYMAVGALEAQFFSALLAGLGIDAARLPFPRDDRRAWPWLRVAFTAKFKSKTRAEWEAVFAGSDACCTPVLGQAELEAAGYAQRPAVGLRGSPGWAVGDEEKSEGEDEVADKGQGVGVEGAGWSERGLGAGEGGEEMLARWMGWSRGRQYGVEGGGLVLLHRAKL
ncbi:uncharacterized protein K452DRAFT_309905 [Aplosporella prunicola CBS 121167]|uniref:Alpha-methylacyl-CoA racemase n=1 Tax=Aplosporella prunicola CBS 121167 TaxID=1176127 RepID=A0A6A6B7H4_9PEZI|nr:uncharacterized protein K452DRAFT_309905 [Aplosporella prunicola CBS 121167]KAF2140112.1 hypothetical protein K452DRAFT_309905 [Aplosporella prunicola CBS 121167]